MLKTGRVLLSLAACLLVACSDSSSDDTGGRGQTGNGSGDGSNLGGGFDNGGGSNVGGAGNGGGSNGGDPTFYDGCAPKDATMWFVVDGSGSMSDGFGASDRWTTLRAALMDPDGAVARLQDVVDFGLVIYDGPIDIGAFLGVPTPGLCPQLVTVPVAKMNHGAMSTAYPQQPLGGSTPTHQGMEAARMEIAATLANPDALSRSQYIILATDGAPNALCDGAPDAAAEVIQQTTMALNEGIQTFVISLAGGDANLTAHLTDVANAGGTGTMPFVPDNKDALVDTLRTIVGGATGCDLLAPE